MDIFTVFDESLPYFLFYLSVIHFLHDCMKNIDKLPFAVFYLQFREKSEKFSAFCAICKKLCRLLAMVIGTFSQNVKA